MRNELKCLTNPVAVNPSFRILAVTAVVRFSQLSLPSNAIRKTTILFRYQRTGSSGSEVGISGCVPGKEPAAVLWIDV